MKFEQNENDWQNKNHSLTASGIPDENSFHHKLNILNSTAVNKINTEKQIEIREILNKPKIREYINTEENQFLDNISLQYDG